MTNEEIAAAIQHGQSGLIPTLWERVERFAYLKARDYFQAHMSLCVSAGVALEDLQQESYFAFLAALRYFDPQCGYTFTTFLRFPLRNAFNTLCGMRTEQARREPLNHAASLDTPTGGRAEGLDLLDTIADEATDIETAEEAIYRQQLHDALENALSTLPEQREKLLRYRFYDGLSYEKAAEKEGLTRDKGRNQIAKGLRELRTGERRRLLEPYRQDIISRHAYHGSFALWRDTGTSSTEYTVLKLEQLERDGRLDGI